MTTTAEGPCEHRQSACHVSFTTSLSPIANWMGWGVGGVVQGCTIPTEVTAHLKGDPLRVTPEPHRKAGRGQRSFWPLSSSSLFVPDSCQQGHPSGKGLVPSALPGYHGVLHWLKLILNESEGGADLPPGQERPDSQTGTILGASQGSWRDSPSPKALHFPGAPPAH